MSSEIALKVENISKCYHIYQTPRDRLKQFVLPRAKKLFGADGENYFREFWALREVSFEIGKGETVGIIGRNGSGKSTLLQMICGTVTPTNGSVVTNGRIAALLELGAGFNPEFTGKENVLLNAAILGFPQSAMMERLNDVIEFSELGEFIHQPVKTYSSGMYARLAFSIAIHVEPEILIVDEALAVGDARFVAKCMRRIKDIQAKGTTILFVSHDVSSVRTLCDRSIWLDNGRLVDDGDVFPITGKYMEFMFRDEVSGVDALRDAVDLVAIEKDTDLALNASVDSEREYIGEILDSRPVAHWGSHKGLILGASVCDSDGDRLEVLAWNELIRVVISVSIPLSVPRENLSIAFSIKDLKGTDLIVSTTVDLKKVILPHKEEFTVDFSFVNPLVTGKYLLVAAVEERSGVDVHYYEYFEGVHYFSSVADCRFFGVFQPEINRAVRCIHGT